MYALLLNVRMEENIESFKTISKPQNYVIRGQYSQRAILEGQYTRRAILEDKHIQIHILACWRHEPKACVSSHNIGSKIPNVPLDKCKDMCVAEKKCKAFEYGVPHGGAKAVYKKNDCQLNDGTDR